MTDDMYIYIKTKEKIFPKHINNVNTNNKHTDTRTNCLTHCCDENMKSTKSIVRPQKGNHTLFHVLPSPYSTFYRLLTPICITIFTVGGWFMTRMPTCTRTTKYVTQHVLSHSCSLSPPPSLSHSLTRTHVHIHPSTHTTHCQHTTHTKSHTTYLTHSLDLTHSPITVLHTHYVTTYRLD